MGTQGECKAKSSQEFVQRTASPREPTKASISGNSLVQVKAQTHGSRGATRAFDSGNSSGVKRCEHCVWGESCDDLVYKDGWSCDYLKIEFGCSCHGCSCPHPSPPKCQRNCFGETCDDAVYKDKLTCAEIESYYGCDCTGCICGAPTIMAPTPAPPTPSPPQPTPSPNLPPPKFSHYAVDGAPSNTNGGHQATICA